MLELSFLNYDNNYNLDIKVTRLVNTTLYEYFNMVSGLDNPTDDFLCNDIIPKGCYRDEKFKARKKLEEIQQIFYSDILRETISPLNEHIIFEYINILCELQECEPELYKLSIPFDMLEEVKKCDEYWIEEDTEDEEDTSHFNMVLDNIFNFTNYKEFLFKDWDFDNLAVNNITQIYLRGLEEKIITQTVHYNNLLPFIERLQEFEELMDDDIYYKYMEFKTMKSKEKKKNNITTTTYIGTQNILHGNSKIDTQINENSNNEEQRKNFIERHGMVAAIIGAIAVIVGAIITIIFN